MGASNRKQKNNRDDQSESEEDETNYAEETIDESDESYKNEEIAPEWDHWEESNRSSYPEYSSQEVSPSPQEGRRPNLEQSTIPTPKTMNIRKDKGKTKLSMPKINTFPENDLSSAEENKSSSSDETLYGSNQPYTFVSDSTPKSVRNQIILPRMQSKSNILTKTRKKDNVDPNLNQEPRRKVGFIKGKTDSLPESYETYCIQPPLQPTSSTKRSYKHSPPGKLILQENSTIRKIDVLVPETNFSSSYDPTFITTKLKKNDFLDYQMNQIVLIICTAYLKNNLNSSKIERQLGKSISGNWKVLIGKYFDNYLLDAPQLLFYIDTIGFLVCQY